MISCEVPQNHELRHRTLVRVLQGCWTWGDNPSSLRSLLQTEQWKSAGRACTHLWNLALAPANVKVRNSLLVKGVSGAVGGIIISSHVISVGSWQLTAV